MESRASAVAMIDPWSRWALNNAQMGILILDQRGHIAYLNQWLLDHTRLDESEWVGKSIAQVFPSLAGSYLEQALVRAAATGFATFLSNSLHPSPFPLYPVNCRRGVDSLIKQSVHIMPMGTEDAALLGQRYVMAQINDMTQAVNRERLLKAKATALQTIARVDALTGIGNRRHFDEAMALEFRHAVRSRSKLSLLMVDVDKFKSYNDTFGHVRGDEALTLIADALRSACHRARDTVARYGGEEMALILPETDQDGAQRVALELRSSIHALNIQHDHNPPSRILTVSIGIATQCADALESPMSLVELADLALYRAKQSGRDGIFAHDGATIMRVVSTDAE